MSPVFALEILSLAVVFRELDVAESSAGFGRGVARRPSLLLQPLRHLGQVELELLVDLGRDARA